MTMTSAMLWAIIVLGFLWVVLGTMEKWFYLVCDLFTRHKDTPLTQKEIDDVSGINPLLLSDKPKKKNRKASK